MKKIMFNDRYGLTEAVLEGRKTMTRRIVQHPVEVEINGHKYLEIGKLRYKVGEVVAVAQKYEDIYNGLSDREARWFLDTLHLRYDDKCARDLPAWRNKEFVRADLMPNQIRITNVRVERLQDISDDDCLREGICVSDTFPKYGVRNGYSPQCANDPKEPKSWYSSPREAFAALIDKISGKGTWASNPWALVYEYELEK